MQSSHKRRPENTLQTFLCGRVTFFFFFLRKRSIHSAGTEQHRLPSLSLNHLSEASWTSFTSTDTGLSLSESHQWPLFFNKRLEFTPRDFKLQPDMMFCLGHHSWWAGSLLRSNIFLCKGATDRQWKKKSNSSAESGALLKRQAHFQAGGGALRISVHHLIQDHNITSSSRFLYQHPTQTREGSCEVQLC